MDLMLCWFLLYSEVDPWIEPLKSGYSTGDGTPFKILGSSILCGPQLLVLLLANLNRVASRNVVIT